MERDLRRIGSAVRPWTPMRGIAEADARRIRQALRQVPAWKLQEVLDAITQGADTGIAVLDRLQDAGISVIEEILSERGKLMR